MKDYETSYNNAMPGEWIEYFRTYRTGLNILPPTQRMWAAHLYDSGLADLAQKRQTDGATCYYIVKRKKQVYIDKYDRLSYAIKERKL